MLHRVGGDEEIGDNALSSASSLTIGAPDGPGTRCRRRTLSRVLDGNAVQRSLGSLGVRKRGDDLAHTTSQATSGPSARQRRIAMSERSRNVGSSVNKSSRTLVSSAVIMPRRRLAPAPESLE